MSAHAYRTHFLMQKSDHDENKLSDDMFNQSTTTTTQI